MKIDITALREAANKFATTLDAHRANPRDALAVTEWDEATSALTDIVGGDENNIIVALIDMLEVERQRAAGSEEELHKALHREKAAERKLLADQEEIAALKAKLANPNVLPVGEIVAWSGTDREKGITREVDFRFLRFDVQPGQQLFTMAPKPVEHPDTKRMDWLCSHVVEVREPLFYGSHSMFWSQCDSDDCEEHHTTLREQVDAAIEAAGRSVKDGD